MKQKEIIIGIDPGRSKCGVALLTPALVLEERDIIPTDQLPDYIQQKQVSYQNQLIILGGGTSSTRVEELIREQINSDIEVRIINEARTTVEAEKRYIRENYPLPLRCLNRLFSWRPSRPVDDYAAQILVEKYIRGSN